jgi:CII-binding regulator of phage lambda lysogenization HflD
MTMTPEDLINELRHKVVLASDERELEAALDKLQSALQEHREYLESVAADYLLSLPLTIRKRLSKLHETMADAA